MKIGKIITTIVLYILLFFTLTISLSFIVELIVNIPIISNILDFIAGLFSFITASDYYPIGALYILVFGFSGTFTYRVMRKFNYYTENEWLLSTFIFGIILVAFNTICGFINLISGASLLGNIGSIIVGIIYIIKGRKF